MPLPAGFLRRYHEFLDGLSRDQKLPREELEMFLRPYPESVQMFLVTAYEVRGLAGFGDCFRLVDLLHNFGCRAILIQAPEYQDPVRFRTTRPDGLLVEASVALAALNLDRAALSRLLRAQLGIDRPTKSTSRIMARGSGLLDPQADPVVEESPADAKRRERVTKQIRIATKPSAEAPPTPASSGDRPWAEVVQMIRGALESLGCTGSSVSAVGRSGFVRIRGSGPDRQPFDIVPPPDSVAAGTPEALRAAFAKMIPGAERAAAAAPAAGKSRPAKRAEKKRADAPPAASEPATTAAAGPDAEVPTDASVATKLTKALTALKCTAPQILALSGGRYLRVEVTDLQARRVAVALDEATIRDASPKALQDTLARLLARAAEV